MSARSCVCIFCAGRIAVGTLCERCQDKFRHELQPLGIVHRRHGRLTIKPNANPARGDLALASTPRFGSAAGGWMCSQVTRPDGRGWTFAKAKPGHRFLSIEPHRRTTPGAPTVLWMTNAFIAGATNTIRFWTVSNIFLTNISTVHLTNIGGTVTITVWFSVTNSRWKSPLP